MVHISESCTMCTTQYTIKTGLPSEFVAQKQTNVRNSIRDRSPVDRGLCGRRLVGLFGRRVDNIVVSSDCLSQLSFESVVVKCSVAVENDNVMIYEINSS